MAMVTIPASGYIWPLSGTTTSPDMNTSFGPRINQQKWDFHDGIDLKAPLGTPVLAMRAAKVHRAGPAGTHGFSSRHVVLRADDPRDGTLYLVHVHLASIDPAVVEGASVTQGQVIGTVGDDDAKYPHLHFEFRKAKPFERFSVHPLRYLPYLNSANFTAPRAGRFNRLNNLMAARLLFDAPDRAEGDLRSVEVDLYCDITLLTSRVVDLNDKDTINEGLGDDKIFVNDIGIEGYQRSNLIDDGRSDLQYGVLVRNLPTTCDRLRARVIDIGGLVSESADIRIPERDATDQRVDFEDELMPPKQWRAIVTTDGESSVKNRPAAAYTGSRGMRCRATASVEREATACIERELPTERFEWIVEGWFMITALALGGGDSLRVLQFQTDQHALSVAARIRNRGNALRVGLVLREPGGSTTSEDGEAAVTLESWHHWKLHVLRVGTRETTAVLHVDTIEQARLDWDTTAAEPRSVRAGIARISPGGKATVLVDDLRVTEATALK